MQKPNLTIFIIFILALSGLSGLGLSLYVHGRTPPTPNPSDIQMLQTFHTPLSFVKQIANDPNAGEKIFKEYCGSCHSQKPIIDVDAPRIGDKKTWQMMRSKGMPTLLSITIKGKKAMPSRGGCFECSDKQLQEAIQYILDQSI